MSPVATIAFNLCVAGDTGLKAGWVRCRHWAGRRGGAGWVLSQYRCCSEPRNVKNIACWPGGVLRWQGFGASVEFFSFVVRVGASVGCEPGFSTLVYIAVQSNVARNVFRGATEIKPKAPVKPPRHGASRMKRTVRTDACDLGVTPRR